MISCLNEIERERERKKKKEKKHLGDKAMQSCEKFYMNFY